MATGEVYSKVVKEAKDVVNQAHQIGSMIYPIEAIEGAIFFINIEAKIEDRLVADQRYM